MAEIIQIKIEALTKDAQKELRKFVKSTNARFDGISKNSKSVATDVQKISKSINNLSGSFLQLGAAFGAFVGIRATVRSFQALAGAAQEYENALIGLTAVGKTAGVSVDQMNMAVQDLASDGLVPVTDISNSLKQLLSKGFNLEESIRLFRVMKDAASFNRQAIFTLGEAIVSTSEGIKNDNSIKTDNVGITRNISLMHKDFAKQLGKTIGQLTEAEKRQAILNGFTKEGLRFTGNAVALTQTYSGAISKLSFAFNKFTVFLGKFITESPQVKAIIDTIAASLNLLTKGLSANSKSLREDFKSGVIAFVNAGGIAITFIDVFARSLKSIPLVGKLAFLTLKEVTTRPIIEIARGALFAVDLIIKSFKAIPPIIIGAFQGILAASIVPFVKIEEAISNLLIKTGRIKEPLNFFTKQFMTLGQNASETGDAVKKVFTSESGINKFIGRIDQLNGTFKDNAKEVLNTGKQIKKVFSDRTDLENTAEGFARLSDKISELGNKKDLSSITKDIKAIKGELSATAQESERLRQERAKSNKTLLDTLAKQLEASAGTELEVARRTEASRQKIISDGLMFGQISREKAAQLRIQLAQKTAEEERKAIVAATKDPIGFAINTASFKTAIKGIGVQFQNLFARGIGGIKGGSLKSFSKGIGKSLSKVKGKDIATFGLGIANSVAQGAKGATKLISGIAAASLGPFGQAAGPLLEVFAQGPEETRKMVKAFADAIPEITQNIVESAPVFVEEFVNQLPRIIDGLVEKIPTLINGLIAATPRLTTEIAKSLAFKVPLELLRSLPEIIEALAVGIAKELPNALINQKKEIGIAIFKGFTEGFKDIGNFFKKIFKFDGKGKGPVEKFLNFDFPFIKFASGGFIPGNPVFKGDSEKNDTVPALLSPGEVVVPRTAVSGGPGKVVQFLKDIGVPGFGFGKFIKRVTRSATETVKKAAAPTLGDVLGTSSPLGRIAGPLFDKLVQFAGKIGLPTGVFEAVQSLRTFGSDIKLTDVVKDPIGAIKGATRNIANKFQDQFRGMMKIPGLENGGLIPSGFPNDTFVAGLSSGENVVSQDLNRKLDSFIDNASQTQEVNQALLLNLVDLVRSPQVVNSEVRLDNETFANIILNLSRDNQRLA